jgi:hypothetical protein
MPDKIERTEHLWNTAQVAKFLGVKFDTVRSWRRKGTGPKFIQATPHVVRYLPEVVREWLEQNSKTSTLDAAGLEACMVHQEGLEALNPATRSPEELYRESGHRRTNMSTIQKTVQERPAAGIYRVACPDGDLKITIYPTSLGIAGKRHKGFDIVMPDGSGFTEVPFKWDEQQQVWRVSPKLRKLNFWPAPGERAENLPSYAAVRARLAAVRIPALDSGVHLVIPESEMWLESVRTAADLWHAKFDWAG